MRITHVESHLLRMPLARPISAPRDGAQGGRLDHVFLLLVYVDTDDGHRGVGFAYSLQGGGRALKVLVDDDLAPLVVGEDPRNHERLAAKVYWRTQSIGRRGLVAQAYSAIDVALWDIKGKVATVPLYKLLGGAREAAPVYVADTGWLWMTPEEISAATRPLLEKKVMGVKIKVGGNPSDDMERVTRLRDLLGEAIWLGVDANQRYDSGTAYEMGRFLEEDIGAGWFEEPISCEDVEGHARLADRLDIPLAVGETLLHREEFQRYLARGAVGVLQPDVTRVGGITEWLKVAALAELYHRKVSPHVLPEIGVHLACGLPCVGAVEYMPWFFEAFRDPPALVKGQIVPPARPGLGLDVNPEVLAKYRVSV